MEQVKREKVINSSVDMKSQKIGGKHCILELYECNSLKLNDELFVRASLINASKDANSKLLNMITHKFQPQGVTGLALLAESHISIHTWPENQYAAIDVFTCGSHTTPESACEVFIKDFEAQKNVLKTFFRERSES